mmetsp:Transcript_27235/g.72286  ORF Transcript_27235/g.72286 Transcript_27235/m.72286 type:complete len:541 (-) Transcript_27235:91-1713(-)
MEYGEPQQHEASEWSGEEARLEKHMERMSQERNELRNRMMTLYTPGDVNSRTDDKSRHQPRSPSLVPKKGNLKALAADFWRSSWCSRLTGRGAGGQSSSSSSLGSGGSTATTFRMSAPLFSQWCSFAAFWAFYSMESLCVMGSQVSSTQAPEAIGIRLTFMAFGLLAGVIAFLLGKRQQWGAGGASFVSTVFADVIALVVFIGFAVTVITNMLVSKGESSNRMFWMVFEGFFFVMVLVHLCRLSPKGLISVVCSCLTVTVILGYVGAEGEEPVFHNELLLECAGSAIFLMVMHIIATVWDPRRGSLDHKAICEEHERVSELLDSMLPKEVLLEMRSGSMSLAYNYKDMTFLFADIVGFTRYCAEHTAEQAVCLVTRLFAEFDEQAVKLGIYKVCTIGDAYVVVNEPKTELMDKFSECMSVFTMAKYMLQVIARVRVEVNFDGLNMRIGLHVGRFVGGVIGTKRLRFDVWGEDVLIGNNVESHGLAGEICVSHTAKEVMEEYGCDLDFAFNQDMTLKTGRVVRTYVCRPARGGSFTDTLLL